MNTFAYYFWVILLALPGRAMFQKHIAQLKEEYAIDVLLSMAKIAAQ